MTSWPTDGYRDVTNVPHIEGLVAGLEFLLWLLTGHIPHYTPAPLVRNDVASRAWTAPPLPPADPESRGECPELGKPRRSAARDAAARTLAHP